MLKIQKYFPGDKVWVVSPNNTTSEHTVRYVSPHIPFKYELNGFDFACPTIVREEDQLAKTEQECAAIAYRNVYGDIEVLLHQLNELFLIAYGKKTA